MAEGGLKCSRSVEGLEIQGKPGKLSHELLSKFTSDPAITQAQSSQGNRLSAQSFSSSSEETALSQENLKSKKIPNVRIKEPDENAEHLSPSSADEDMLSDEEAGQERKKKKRSLKWKWSPFKKMRSLFKRKKSPTRVKSCEALPTEHYKATYVPNTLHGDDGDTLRNRTKSEPALTDVKLKTPVTAIEVYERRNTSDTPLYRTHSDPSSKLDADELLLKGLNNMQDKGQGESQDSVIDEPTMSSDSLLSVGTSLDWSLISSEGGIEASVSFENLPSVSSMEGLQAAHDRIKIAPKHRRPPTRMHAKSSSMNLKNNPVKPHRRSTTDPKGLTAKSLDSKYQGLGSRNNSGVISGTLLETQEVLQEPSKESIVSDLKMKVNNILRSLDESSEATSQGNATGTEEKETQVQAEKGKSKQDLIIESTADNKQVELFQTDNMGDIVTNKENESIDSKQGPLQLESEKEHVKAEDEVLKEHNGKKEVSRPVLDMGRRSESLQIFEVKGNSKEMSPRDKPPMRKGHSFSSTESKGTMTQLNLTELIESKKQSETAEKEGKTSDFENSAEEVNDGSSKQDFVPEDGKTSSSPNMPAKKALNKDQGSKQPAWIELANKRSQRLSQLIEEGGQEHSKVLLKVASGVSHAPAKIPDKKNGEKDDELSPTLKEKPKVPSKPGALSRNVSPAKPRLLSKVFSDIEDTKLPGIKPPIIQNKPTVHNQIDKCVVCGTRVYQMEKCNFDSSVLHKQCIKCAVCKRLLTVGNFVMAESKVYCKPHAKSVTVST